MEGEEIKSESVRRHWLEGEGRPRNSGAHIYSPHRARHVRVFNLEVVVPVAERRMMGIVRLVRHDQIRWNTRSVAFRTKAGQIGKVEEIEEETICLKLDRKSRSSCEGAGEG